MKLNRPSQRVALSLDFFSFNNDYSNSDAIGTKMSGHYGQSGCSLGVAINRVMLINCKGKYRRLGFNCEYLLIANCEFFYVSQLIDSQT